MYKSIVLSFAILTAALVQTPTLAQDMQGVEIKPIPVAGNIYMLTGRGGNMGLSVGEDGDFLIDDQYAPLTDKITAAIKQIADQPVRFVINTHWHADHTGGNENLGNAGAVIVAHENVRKRLSTEQFIESFGRRVAPSPPGALPKITFSESVTFHWNGDEVHIFHVPRAHTDGDSIIHFKRANVVHMGDTFFNGMYPFIDASSGGSIDGMIAAVDEVMKHTNAETKFIPGHGELADMAGLENYRRMLATVRDRIRPLLAQGKTTAEIIAAKPTAEFDATWGTGFLKPDRWVEIVCAGMHKD